MDSSSFVERYAWFGAMENLQGVNSVSVFPVLRGLSSSGLSYVTPSLYLQENALMDSQGNINALGEQYIGGNQSTTSSGSTTHQTHRIVAIVIAAMTLMYSC